MPVAFTTELVSETPLPKEPLGSKLHGLIFYLLKQANPSFSDLLHEGSERRSFTLSYRFLRGNKLWVRTTFLDDRVLPLFTAQILKANGSLRLDKTKVYPLRICFNDEKNWCGISNYSELYNSAKLDREIILHFDTTTTFKHGDLDLPLPIPKLVFEGYYEKWTKYSSIRLDKDLLKAIDRHLELVDFKIRPSSFQSGYDSINGFIGNVIFKIRGKLDIETIKQINLLADFSFFAGTGRKTTHGMGMTRRIK